MSDPYRTPAEKQNPCHGNECGECDCSECKKKLEQSFMKFMSQILGKYRL